jgi:hypothetical protein
VVSLFPGIHRLFTVAVAVVGLGVLGYVLVKRRPKSPAALSRLIGWIMTVAILLAPATRVGYLLYPVDFFVWAWLLRSEDTVDPVPDDPGSLRRPLRVGGSAFGSDGGEWVAGDGDEYAGSSSEGDSTRGTGQDRSRVLTAVATRLGSILVRHRVQLDRE